MPSNTPRVVSIVGPTASGKTGLGIAIALFRSRRDLHIDTLTGLKG